MRQRADLTYKHNVERGRHGWLRLTPAYSVRLVEGVLAEFGAGARTVLEPFSGTGTTPLCASYRGMTAVATDINPFLVWLARVKGAHYSAHDRSTASADARDLAARLGDDTARRAPLPPLKNIERWWDPAALAAVAHLRGELAEHAPGPARDLLDVAFCRTLIGLSNVAFNHPSMSFKATATTAALDAGARFVADVEAVVAAAADNPSGSIRVERADARTLAGEDGAFDLLITSPPYPNRMSYIRELRPYMYWLGFLGDAKSAGELDWTAIGGTWGVATSRLLNWQPDDAFIPASLPPIIERIRAAHPKNGPLMAQYVHKYFADMFAHFTAAARRVRRGGTAHYVVGNSSFYGHLVPAEALYCEQLLCAGFGRAEARAIRKRNSKRELVEYHVIAER